MFASLAFSPDGKLLASVDYNDGTIRVWDTNSGNEIRSLAIDQELKRTDASVVGALASRVAFSPDGRTLASATTLLRNIPIKDARGQPPIRPNEGIVLLWDMATGKVIRTLKGHTQTIRVVAFSPDGRTIFSGGEDCQLKLWDAATGKEKRTIREKEPNWVYDVAFSPGGNTVALSMGSNLRLIDAASGDEIRRFPTQEMGIGPVVFSPDGRTVASVGTVIKLWDAEIGQRRALPSDSTGAVKAVAFSPDGQTLAWGHEAGTAVLWEVATRKTRNLLKGDWGSVEALAFSPDGQALAAAGHQGTVKRWEVDTGKERRSVQARGWVRSVAFSPNGQLLATAPARGHVQIWDAGTGQHLRDLLGLAGRSVSFSPDGRSVASGGNIWDAFNGQVRLALPKVHGPSALSPDGQTLAAGSPVQLWDRTSGKARASLDGHGSYATFVSYSRDGKQLVTSSGDGTIRLWDAHTGANRQIVTLGTPGSLIHEAAFSPDGRYVATANGNGTVYLLRLATADR
jgi:WD40 repeat protein